MKKIIINVDDLGFSPAVNQAVIHLAEKKRIQATSFMSLGEIHSDEVVALKQSNIDIGLHFDLTGLAEQGSLKQILLKAYLRQFSAQQLTDLIEQQLDQFEHKIGSIPAFIDGHQHVHQFPQIRQQLLSCIEKRYQQKIPIRNTSTYQQELKAKIIFLLGGFSLKQQLQQSHWPHNPSFAGIYNFDADVSGLKNLWQMWLEGAPNNSVIMCHPAKKIGIWDDEIAEARYREYQWLLSDDFEDLWNQMHCYAQYWRDL
jgi:chitin disaccharide deacetylase